MSDSEQRVIDLIAALQAGAPGAEDLIEDLCGALTEDAGRLVLAHGSTLASRLRDVGITMQPQGAALPRRSLH
jgi:hypothetical protein